MDWNSILWAGVFGAVGGGIGALVGGWAAKRFNKPSLISIFVVVFVLMAINAKSFIIGPAQTSGQTAEEAVDEILQDEKFFAIILSDHPDKKTVYRDRLLQAYNDGGETGLLNATALLGQEIGRDYVGEYLAFAGDEATLKFIRNMLESTKYLAETDAVLCFHWMNGGMPDLGERLKFPPKITNLQGSSMMAVLISGNRNRGNKSNPPLKALSAEETASISADIVNRLGDYISKDQIFIEGTGNPAIVSTDVEKANVCWTTLAMWLAITDLPAETAAAYARQILQ